MGLFRKQEALEEPKSPDYASEPQRDWIRDQAERLSAMEGEMRGMMVKIEELGEGLHRLVAKLNKRARDEAKRLEQPELPLSDDPRISKLQRTMMVIPPNGR